MRPKNIPFCKERIILMLCRNSVVAKIWRKIRIYVAYQRTHQLGLWLKKRVMYTLIKRPKLKGLEFIAPVSVKHEWTIWRRNTITGIA